MRAQRDKPTYANVISTLRNGAVTGQLEAHTSTLQQTPDPIVSAASSEASFTVFVPGN